MLLSLNLCNTSYDQNSFQSVIVKSVNHGRNRTGGETVPTSQESQLEKTIFYLSLPKKRPINYERLFGASLKSYFGTEQKIDTYLFRNI